MIVDQLPLSALAAIFTAAAAVVWMAGTRLAHYVDGIARKTDLGHAFTGMLLLGGITSLPEVAAVSTSASIGNAPLAVNNLLGTASINLVLLGVADVIYGRGALTKAAAEPGTLMQGVLSMVLAAAVAMFATIGDVQVPGFGFGAGSAALLLGCVGALWLASDFESRHVWEVVREDSERRRSRDGGRTSDVQDWSLGKLSLATAVAAAAILMAGFFLSISADAIADSTGIGAGVIGFLLVGASTSLPEISSIVGAVRLRRYEMAVGDIFGTNLFNISLIFLADAIYTGEPVLDGAGEFETVGAILAVLLTGIFAVGLIERRDRTILRMSYSTLTVFIVFTAGVAALFAIGRAA